MAATPASAAAVAMRRARAAASRTKSLPGEVGGALGGDHLRAARPRPSAAVRCRRQGARPEAAPAPGARPPDRARCAGAGKRGTGRTAVQIALAVPRQLTVCTDAARTGGRATRPSTASTSPSIAIAALCAGAMVSAWGDRRRRHRTLPLRAALPPSRFAGDVAHRTPPRLAAAKPQFRLQSVRCRRRHVTASCTCRHAARAMPAARHPCPAAAPGTPGALAPAPGSGCCWCPCA